MIDIKLCVSVESSEIAAVQCAIGFDKIYPERRGSRNGCVYNSGQFYVYCTHGGMLIVNERETKNESGE